MFYFFTWKRGFEEVIEVGKGLSITFKIRLSFYWKRTSLSGFDLKNRIILNYEFKQDFLKKILQQFLISSFEMKVKEPRKVLT